MCMFQHKRVKPETNRKRVGYKYVEVRRERIGDIGSNKYKYILVAPIRSTIYDIGTWMVAKDGKYDPQYNPGFNIYAPESQKCAEASTANCNNRVVIKVYARKLKTVSARRTSYVSYTGKRVYEKVYAQGFCAMEMFIPKDEFKRVMKIIKKREQCGTLVW